MAAAAFPAIDNLVHELTTSTGTGNLSTSAVNGKQTFNGAFSNGATTDVFYYFVSNRDVASEREYGTGHMSAASTLVRDTILGGSNGTSAVNFSAGTKDILCDVPASLQLSAALSFVNPQTGTTYTVLDTDRGKTVTFSNTSSVAVTLPQAGTSLAFQSGWFACFRNLNRGAVTITPTTSTINGAASITLQRGQNVRISSDGTNYQILTGSPRVIVQAFTGSGTYTPTAGMSYCIIECIAGGGGGGGSDGSGSLLNFSGGAGGSGSYSRLTTTAAAIGASQTVTIGAGGAGGAAGANVGAAGADTSVGTLCIGKGGSPGFGGSAAAFGTGGAGGVAGTGDVTPAGQSGSWGSYSNLVGTSGNIQLGGPTGAPGYFGGGGTGGQSVAGGNGVYGGGGGGGNSFNTASDFAGGNGGNGFVIVTEFVNH